MDHLHRFSVFFVTTSLTSSIDSNIILTFLNFSISKLLKRYNAKSHRNRTNTQTTRLSENFEHSAHRFFLVKNYKTFYVLHIFQIRKAFTNAFDV